jgi:hypothetical protein
MTKDLRRTNPHNPTTKMQQTDAIEGFLEWQRAAMDEESMALITDVADDDVLLGRGTTQAKRPANAWYRRTFPANLSLHAVTVAHSCTQTLFHCHPTNTQ